jgi:acyl-homoserine-lactone acylase
MSSRLRAGGAVLAAASLLLTVVAAAPPSSPPSSPPGPPDGRGPDPSRPDDGVLSATIHRTSYGFPHIVADDYASLGFGQGYAIMESSPCVILDTLLTARGERSKFFGPDAHYTDQVTLSATNLQTDVLFTNLRDRQVVEELLADPARGPSDEVRDLVRGYVAGANQYLEDVGGPDGITDPACAGADWVIEDATPLDLWYGVFGANLLASTGVFVPQIVDAAPPTPDPLGSAAGAATADGFAPVPEVLPSAEELEAALGKDPEATFGSNGTALGGDVTATGRGMVLGNPHFPWRGRYRFVQAHLTIPGEYDVAGAMLHGSPVVNIGWNNDVAWTHTVSTAFRFTPYEYRTLPGLPTTYLTTEGPRQLDRQEVEVEVKRADGTIETVVEDVYRTDEGYVLHAPDVLMNWTPVSFFALRDANAEHLQTIDVFHEMSKASDVAELLEAHDRTGGMPWVNTIAADRHGDALYADHSVVPNVPDELVTRCATPIGHVLFQLAGLPALDGTRAQSDCAWEDDEDAPRPGMFGDGNLPEVFTRDWVVNANDSYWLPNPDLPLEGFDRIIGCERCERSLRTRMVYRYVMDRLDGSDGLGGDSVFTHEQLQAVEHQNRVFAAELARENDDLQAVCQAADGGEACDVLANWDGRTDVDSRGAHLFREFFVRTPAGSRWQQAFDADRPVETPRDLDEGNADVVQAMRDAISFLQDRGVALDAPLGELQVAGDDGAPPIPVGGGLGTTGNANVVQTSNPAANRGRLYPVSFGSSHIQAVAFTDGGVDAATILTYGISTNATDPNSSDQTELFSQERWVDVPFTMAEILADPNHTRKVVTDGGSPRRPGPPPHARVAAVEVAAERVGGPFPFPARRVR